MRREGVIDESNAFRHRMIGDLLRRTDPADAAAIDLDEADTAIVDQVLRHVDIVRAFATGELHVLAALGQRPIGPKRTRGERLLEPGRARRLERRQPLRGALDVVDEDLPGIDQQDRVRAEPFARGGEMLGVLRGRTAPDRAPAELGGAEILRPCTGRRAFRPACRRTGPTRTAFGPDSSS